MLYPKNAFHPQTIIALSPDIPKVSFSERTWRPEGVSWLFYIDKNDGTTLGSTKINQTPNANDSTRAAIDHLFTGAMSPSRG